MLVLSRKVNEYIVLTVGKKQVLIYLAKIDGDSARIGIDAPSEVKIYRKELYDTIMESNCAAAIPQSEKPQRLPRLA